MSTTTPRKSSVKVAPVHQHDDGTIHALSSNGVTVYVVRLGDVVSCTCPAGANGRHCYHVATARARFGAFYTAPWAVLVPEVEPEPPTPAAPAVRRPQLCQAALYDGCECPRCAAQVAA